MKSHSEKYSEAKRERKSQRARERERERKKEGKTTNRRVAKKSHYSLFTTILHWNGPYSFALVI